MFESEFFPEPRSEEEEKNRFLKNQLFTAATVNSEESVEFPQPRSDEQIRATLKELYLACSDAWKAVTDLRAEPTVDAAIYALKKFGQVTEMLETNAPHPGDLKRLLDDDRFFEMFAALRRQAGTIADSLLVTARESKKEFVTEGQEMEDALNVIQGGLKQADIYLQSRLKAR